MKRIISIIMITVILLPILAIFPNMESEAWNRVEKWDVKRGSMIQAVEPTDSKTEWESLTNTINVVKDLTICANDLGNLYFYKSGGTKCETGAADADKNDWDWWQSKSGLKQSDFEVDNTLNGLQLMAKYLTSDALQANGKGGVNPIFAYIPTLEGSTNTKTLGLSALDYYGNQTGVENYIADKLGLKGTLKNNEKGLYEYDIISLYALVDLGHKTKDNTYRRFAACDFDVQNDRFIYYYVQAVAQSGADDELYIIVMTSDELYNICSYDFNDGIELGFKHVAKDFTTGQPTFVQHNGDCCWRKDGLYNIALRLYDEDVMYSLITGVDWNDGKKKKIDEYDKLLKYYDDTTTVGIITSGYIHIQCLDTPYMLVRKNMGVPKELELANDGKTIESPSIILEHCTRLTMESISTGQDQNTETDTLDGFQESITGDFDNCLNRIVGDIVNTISNNSGDSTSGSVDQILHRLFNGVHGPIDKSMCDNHFIASILYSYKDILDAAISESHIRDRINASDKTALSDDNIDTWFEAAQTLLALNIQESANKHGGGLNKTYLFPKAPGITDDSKKLMALKSNISNEIWWTSLSDFQRSELYTVYTKKWERISDRLSDSSKISMFGTIIDDEKSFSLDSAQNILNKLSSDGHSFDWAKENIQSKDISDAATGTIQAYCSYVDLAAEYIVYGSLYSNNAGNATDESSVYYLYSAELDTLVNNLWNYEGISDNYLSRLPSEIGIFGENGKDFVGMLETKDNWQRFCQMLANVDYAFAVCAFSDISLADKNTVYTPDDIKGWFNSETGQEEFKTLAAIESGTDNWSTAKAIESWATFDSSTKYIIRSMIALEQLCDFLEIPEGSWSPQIEAYREVYKLKYGFFEAVKNSGVLYALADTGTKTAEEPLGVFFSITGKSMTDQWIEGFALSSLYVPMETNVYDASSVTWLNDSQWVSDFYYKYGFYRKALYINTDNSAIVNKFVQGTNSGTRVATLNDLLNYDRDIVLTPDDNFYNARDIDTIISRLDYTAIRNSNTDEEAENTDTGFQQVGNAIAGMLDLDAGSILKTGTVTQYSQTLKTNCSSLKAAKSDRTWTQKVFDEYLLSSEEILGDDQSAEPVESALDAYDYTVKTPYAVVSAIYRNDDLYNETIKCAISDTAIFKSSKAIASTPGTTSSNWRCLYNYYMLANLAEQMKNDSATVLDLDAPIFCDIFGNILTESGLVIIPAACNATLCGENWSPYTVGWSTYYNNGIHMTTDDFNTDVYEWLIGQPVTPANTLDIDNAGPAEKKNGGGYFVISGKDLVLLTSELTSGNVSGIIQWDVINKNSTVVQQLFFNDAYFKKGRQMYNHTLTNLVIETMRGAPIENIDYTYEGLSASTDISKYGVYMAYKLEELVDMLGGGSSSGNSIVTMPNLAFMDGLEYIMLYVFKIVFSIAVIGLGIHLYVDAVKGGLGVKSVISFIATCMMVIVAFTLLPNLTNWTYYNANKNLLAEEAGRLMMLNYVKDYDGSEIGITKVTTPETETTLYMKLSDVDVSWWTILPDVLFGSTDKSISDLYQEELKDNAMAMTPDVEMKGDGLYVSTQAIFDSSDIQFVPASNMLQHYTRIGYSNVSVPTTFVDGVDASGNPIYRQGNINFSVGTNCLDVVSFVTPYYAILDQLVASINEYNVNRDISAYSWSVGSNGHVLTYDVISPYLTSPEFIEDGYDILGMDRILRLPVQRTLYNYAFEDDDLEKMMKSSWYRYWEDTSSNAVQDKIDKLYLYARDYIADNRDVLGKVPDEVFLKTFAMQLAVEYNKIFKNIHGNAIEIIDVDTRDLMRFMVSDFPDLYKYYSYSFSRYVYEEGGTIGVVFAALLLVVFWFTGIVKPIIMMVILGLLVVNVLLRKTIFTKSNKAVEGYLIGMACLCLCNYAYAFALKGSLNIANAGLGTITALAFGLVIQILYVAGLIGICAIELKDWKNNGFYNFATIGQMVVSNLNSIRDRTVSRLIARGNEAYHDSNARNMHFDNVSMGDLRTMADMHARDAERMERGTYNPA